MPIAFAIVAPKASDHLARCVRRKLLHCTLSKNWEYQRLPGPNPSCDPMFARRTMDLGKCHRSIPVAVRATVERNFIFKLSSRAKQPRMWRKTTQRPLVMIVLLWSYVFLLSLRRVSSRFVQPRVGFRCLSLTGPGTYCSIEQTYTFCFATAFSSGAVQHPKQTCNVAAGCRYTLACLTDDLLPLELRSCRSSWHIATSCHTS